MVFTASMLSVLNITKICSRFVQFIQLLGQIFTWSKHCVSNTKQFHSPSPCNQNLILLQRVDCLRYNCNADYILFLSKGHLVQPTSLRTQVKEITRFLLGRQSLSNNPTSKRYINKTFLAFISSLIADFSDLSRWLFYPLITKFDFL